MLDFASLNNNPTLRYQQLINKALSELRTTIPCRVTAVQAGQNGAVGTVTIQPLISLIDQQGNASALPVVYNVPYFRLQAGSCAIVIDPQVGDIGLAIVCDRDSSTVKQSTQVAPPTSRRRFDLSDSFYVGIFLSQQAPQTFINITPGKVAIKADEIDLVGQVVTSADVKVGGGLTATNDVKAGNVSLQNHVHSGVQSGSSMTGKAQ